MGELALGHRFAVVFLAGGVLPNPIDIRFQRVAGLAARVETVGAPQGGQNLYTLRLPTRIAYENLVLERGFVVGSPLTVELNATMSLFRFNPGNVMVTLLAESGAPIAAWLFLKAWPVRWATADLNANDGRVLIDTLELAYTRMQVLRV